MSMQPPLSTSTPSVKWAEQSSAKLDHIGDSGTLILPIGATEQHGPHLPVGVDAMVAEYVAIHAAQRSSSDDYPIFVAPVLAYGSSHHHLPKAGTLSFSSTTMLAALRDLLDSAARTGFRRLLILNGHGGNEDVARQAIRDTALVHPVVAGSVAYWSLAWEETVAIAARYGVGPVPGHAGSFETSLLLALHPELVSQDIPSSSRVTVDRKILEKHPLSGPVVESHRWVHRLGGYSDESTPASAEAGEAILSNVVGACSNFLSNFARTPLKELLDV